MSAMAASTRTRSSPPISRELEHFAALAPGRTVTSIFFGGGTPSLMGPADGRRDPRSPSPRFGASMPDAEITLEANPTTVEAERFAGYRAAGVNRVRSACRRSTIEASRRSGACTRPMKRLRALASGQAQFRARVLRSDLCARGSERASMAERAHRARSTMRARSSLALSAHHRARHAVRRAACGRHAAAFRTRAWRASSIC